jgi:hypothetical protein
MTKTQDSVASVGALMASNSLPIQSPNATGLTPAFFQRFQTLWKAILDPVVQNPSNQSNLLVGLSLTAGINVINHKLGRTMQGWIIADQTGIATIYRSQPMNDQSLTLTVSAAVVVSLEVF